MIALIEGIAEETLFMIKTHKDDKTIHSKLSKAEIMIDNIIKKCSEPKERYNIQNQLKDTELANLNNGVIKAINLINLIYKETKENDS